jgi:hypothetical protein
MSWIYTVDKGIKDSSSGQSIDFDSGRDDLRHLLNFDPLKNTGRFDSEDSYENINGTEDWLRLSFDKEERLREIEILSGTIYLDDKEIRIEGDLIKTIKELEKLGTKFIENDYGFVSPEFKFDLGDSEKTGGDDNKISWFYSTTNIDHLLS